MKKPTGPHAALIARLKALGCVFCPLCYCYMPPEHTDHCLSVAVDLHVSRYTLTGGYGDVVAEVRKAAGR